MLSLITIEGYISRKRINGSDKPITITVVLEDEDHHQHNRQVSVDSQHPSMPFLFVDAIVRIQGRQEDEEGLLSTAARRPHKKLKAETIDLVQCAPHSLAVAHVMDRVLEGALLDWTLPLSRQQLLLLEMDLDSSRRMTISQMVRMLKGSSGAGCRDPRRHKSRACPKRAAFELLDEIEKRGHLDISSLWKLRSTESVPPDDASPLSTPPSATLNKRWIQRVQHQPEIQWITDRISRLKRRPRHILDVGGGRGDLALDIVTRLKGAIVTIVDKQESSDATRELLRDESINLVHADFFDFMHQNDNGSPHSSIIQSLPPIDFVVGFHACGNLSDLAIEFSKQQSCSFLVCPCCYDKRCGVVPGAAKPPAWHACLKTEQEVEVLEELAELTMIHHVNKRARHIINSLRLHCAVAEEEGAWVTRLEEYEESNNKSSLRNMVLIGEINTG